jgi:hypothetical protein
LWSRHRMPRLCPLSTGSAGVRMFSHMNARWPHEAAHWLARSR